MRKNQGFSEIKFDDNASQQLVFIRIVSVLEKYPLIIFQNPREAISRSRIFLISLRYVCMYLYVWGGVRKWEKQK